MINVQAILEGYRQGYFLMADEDENLVWYTSSQRALIPLDNRFHVSRSLRRVLKSGRFTTRVDGDFEGTIRGCMARDETWITEELVEIYLALHQAGVAHSFESWQDGKLAGGVLGLVLGSAFIGETMFHYQTDASKVAMAMLVRHLNDRDFRLFDAQILNPFLATFGAHTVSDREYRKELERCLREEREFELMTD